MGLPTIKISHRGNLLGPIPLLENQPHYIQQALETGFECEVDVWFFEGRFWLGHDKPNYLVETAFLQHEKVLCHAKNGISLQKLVEIKSHCFWNVSDTYAMTSKSFIWTFSRHHALRDVVWNRQSIIFFPGRMTIVPFNCFAICSDYVQEL